MWTVNFRMFKLVLEKAEEPEIKLPTSAGSQKKQESSRKTPTFLYWLCQSLWLCGSQQTVENSERDGNTRPLTCLLRNLYAGQEATVRTGHGTTDWFQIGKEYVKAEYCHPAYLNLYAGYIMWNARLDEAQAGIKIARYANDTTLMAEEWRRTKEPLDESERGEWKSWLKTHHSEN